MESGQIRSIDPIFEVGKTYIGICTEALVVEKGGKMCLRFCFAIDDFVQYTDCFLGSDKVGKDGKTNDDRMKDNLAQFGMNRSELDTNPKVMDYIREHIIGQEIEFQAEDYKGTIQFSGCRVPGSIRGPKIVVTDNPFGYRPPASEGVKF